MQMKTSQILLHTIWVAIFKRKARKKENGKSVVCGQWNLRALLLRLQHGLTTAKSKCKSSSHRICDQKLNSGNREKNWKDLSRCLLPRVHRSQEVRTTQKSAYRCMYGSQRWWMQSMEYQKVGTTWTSPQGLQGQADGELFTVQWVQALRIEWRKSPGGS